MKKNINNELIKRKDRFSFVWQLELVEKAFVVKGLVLLVDQLLHEH